MQTEDKDFKIAIMNIFKVLKEDINEAFNEVCETTKKKSTEMINRVQYIKVEIEALKKIQTEEWD